MAKDTNEHRAREKMLTQRSEGTWAGGRTRSTAGHRGPGEQKGNSWGPWCDLRGAKLVKESLQEQMGKGIGQGQDALHPELLVGPQVIPGMLLLPQTDLGFTRGQQVPDNPPVSP